MHRLALMCYITLPLLFSRIIVSSPSVGWIYNDFFSFCDIQI